MEGGGVRGRTTEGVARQRRAESCEPGEGAAGAGEWASGRVGGWVAQWPGGWAGVHVRVGLPRCLSLFL